MILGGGGMEKEIGRGGGGKRQGEGEISFPLHYFSFDQGERSSEKARGIGKKAGVKGQRRFFRALIPVVLAET